jgi:hypothetical protein
MRYKVVAEIPRNGSKCEYAFNTIEQVRNCALWLEKNYGAKVTVFENRNSEE